MQPRCQIPYQTKSDDRRIVGDKTLFEERTNGSIGRKCSKIRNDLSQSLVTQYSALPHCQQGCSRGSAAFDVRAFWLQRFPLWDLATPCIIAMHRGLACSLADPPLAVHHYHNPNATRSDCINSKYQNPVLLLCWFFLYIVSRDLTMLYKMISTTTKLGDRSSYSRGCGGWIAGRVLFVFFVLFPSSYFAYRALRTVQTSFSIWISYGDA